MGPAALVLEGGAGIGKSTLWREGLRLARERSYRVLQARPGPSETKLSFSGLTDLLEVVLDEVLPSLPSPQRRALGVALLRIEARRLAPDARTIALAFRSCLTTLAERGPVLVAVDDLQWLDSPSVAALHYAAQRLGNAPVGLLLACRVELRESITLELEHGLPVRRVEVGPLSLGALHELLRDRLGRTMPRPVLLSVHETYGGNPFFALEVARALVRRDAEVKPGTALPVPEQLHDLVRARLEQLPSDTQDSLAVIAAQVRPTVATIDQEALDAAVRADVVVVDGDEVRFVHPLLASAARELAGPGRRRSIHAALAEETDDVEERARHLALASAEPNERVASALDEAARLAATRGAPYAAAELAEMAARRTPAEKLEEQFRRRLDGAVYLRAAGDGAGVRNACEQLLPELPAGPFRGQVLNLLAAIREDDLNAALGFAERALAEAAGDPEVGARAEMLIGTIMLIQGDLKRSQHHRHAAVELAERSGDHELLALLIGHAAHNENLMGRYTPGLLERGLRLEQEHEILLDYGPTFVAGLRAMYADRLDEGRARLEAVQRAAIDAGDETNLGNVYLHLAELECRAGDLAGAERFAIEGLERAEQSRSRPFRGSSLLHPCSHRLDARRRGDHEAGRRSRVGARLAWGRLLRPAALGPRLPRAVARERGGRRRAPASAARDPRSHGLRRAERESRAAERDRGACPDR